MLKKHEGKAVYIDFWASWCSPCIKDITESEKSKAYLKEKDVVYLYIGHNDQIQNWSEAVNKYEITENQYLGVDSKSSPVAKHFSIIGIPRYILLDKNHIVANIKAPRPVPRMFSEFEHEIQRLFSVRSWGNR